MCRLFWKLNIPAFDNSFNIIFLMFALISWLTLQKKCKLMKWVQRVSIFIENNLTDWKLKICEGRQTAISEFCCWIYPRYVGLGSGHTSTFSIPSQQMSHGLLNNYDLILNKKPWLKVKMYQNQWEAGIVYSDTFPKNHNHWNLNPLNKPSTFFVGEHNAEVWGASEWENDKSDLRSIVVITFHFLNYPSAAPTLVFIMILKIWQGEHWALSRKNKTFFNLENFILFKILKPNEKMKFLSSYIILQAFSFITT